MVFVKKQATAAAAAAAARSLNTNHPVAVNGTKRADGDQIMQDVSAEVSGEIARRENGIADASSQQPSQSSASTQGDTSTLTPPSASQQAAHAAVEGQASFAIRQAWEHVDEVVQILKTAFPLLILSMETMVDQILQRFKATPEEEIYRLICMLLQDAVQVGYTPSFLVYHSITRSRTI